MTEQTRNGATGDTSRPGSRVARDPERSAEEWAERIGRLILRGAARAKEEAEDIWAEAQALRRDL